jgi:hypothetical protein
VGHLDDTFAAARRSLAKRLSASHGTWQDDGSRVTGPAALAVVVGQRHGADPGHGKHFDVGFLLRRHDPGVPPIWDCCTGLGATAEEQIDDAIQSWYSITGMTCLELIEQQGRHAPSIGPEDPEGLPGWHVIHGPFGGRGTREQAAPILDWLEHHPLMPPLARLLASRFDRKELNGIRLVLGGTGTQDIVEARINGEHDLALSEALRRLPWPRPSTHTYLRTFVVAVHPVGHVAGSQ